MKLSVAIITYNHARFIGEAIEGALNQRTNFDYEIVIGEDESSDGTRDIVADYAKKYPGKIKALFHSRKDVIYYRGKPTARFNLIQTLKQCTGDYVAMLDGDDFWIDPDKLQQQVDFLEAHPEFAICAHDVVKLFPDGKKIPLTNSTASYDFVDLLTLKHYPSTCSIVYRNHLFTEFPDWFSRVMVGDFSLNLLNAQFGRIAHLPKIMGTYRQHPGGMWTSWADHGKKAYSQRLNWNGGLIDLYQTVDEAFGRKYHTAIRRRVAELNYESAWIHYEMHDLPATRRNVFEALKHAPLRKTIAWPQLLRLWTVALCPWGYRLYTKAKGKPLSEQPA